MKTLINVALWVVGLFAIGMTMYCFLQERTQADSKFMYTIIWLLVALICFFVWIFMRKKEESEEEISIMK